MKVGRVSMVSERTCMCFGRVGAAWFCPQSPNASTPPAPEPHDAGNARQLTATTDWHRKHPVRALWGDVELRARQRQSEAGAPDSANGMAEAVPGRQRKYASIRNILAALPSSGAVSRPELYQPW